MRLETVIRKLCNFKGFKIIGSKMSDKEKNSTMKKNIIKKTIRAVLLCALMSSSVKAVGRETASIGNQQTAIPNSIGYSGAYADRESNMEYLKARFYDVELKTFLQFDTYHVPNRYGYCDGNPVEYTERAYEKTGSHRERRGKMAG